MKNPNIKLDDLLTLEGVEKPLGVLQMTLGQNPQGANKLQGDMDVLARKMEKGDEICAEDVRGVVEGLRIALKKELSPEKAARFIEVLRERFENDGRHYSRIEGLKWEEVSMRIQSYPEKLWSLHEMERTGGEPDIVGRDEKDGTLIFMDCSEQSPTGRRNCVYDRAAELELKRKFPDKKSDGNVLDMVILMGVNLASVDEYTLLQRKGVFDTETTSWLKTSPKIRKKGQAQWGNRVVNPVNIGVSTAYNVLAKKGFRAILSI